jgi:hypothetical protein
VSLAARPSSLWSEERLDARSRLEQTVRGLGADGIVGSAMTLRVRSHECRGRREGIDHFAEAVITGTAVARFAGWRTTAPPPSLAVLSLNADAGRTWAAAHATASKPFPSRV